MIYALVVVYNKSCNNSRTIASLLKVKQREINVIVFDNSTSDFSNSAFCSEHGYKYYGFQKNLGLSRAYNYVIDRLNNDEGHIIILDDDTEFDSSFIDEVLRIDNNNNSDYNDTNHIDNEYDNIDNNTHAHNHFTCVYLPIVNAKFGNEVKIISPSNLRFECTSQILNSISEIDYNKITAINSGMFISLSVFQSIRYNEDLFLDCIDHCFMRTVREKGMPIKLLSSKIKQSFSRGERTSLEGALHRYKLFRQDLYVYSKICNNRLFYYAFIFKHTLINTIRYKSLAFLKLLMKSMI